MKKSTDTHMDIYKHIYDYGVLSPGNDKALVMNIEKYAKDAGIPAHYIYRSMFDFTENGVADWMRYYKGNLRRGIYGACLVSDDDALKKFSAVIGCAIRNYINARLMTIQEVIDSRKEGLKLSYELIAVPNFYVSKEEGGNIPTWDSALLLSWLYERYAASQQTVIYVSNMQNLGSAYGTAFQKFITNHYETIGG